MWQTAVSKSAAFQGKEAIEKWVGSAHNITHDLFKDMLKPEFYESFK